MKNLFNIALKAAIVVVAFAGLQMAASAQTKEIAEPLSEFSAINVANDFKVTLNRGDEYSASIVVDEVLAPYVKVNVQGKTLFISYNEKDLPKDVKKIYSGRNAPKPVFNAVITVPAIESVTISNNVVLNSTTPFDGIDKFELVANDKSEVTLFSVSARSAVISLQKNTTAVMNVNTENTLEVNTKEGGSIRLQSSAAELVVNAAGSSRVAASNMSEKVTVDAKGKAQVSISGPCTDAVIAAEGSDTKVTLSGGGASIKVKSTKAEVDAYSFEVTTADVDLAKGAVLKVNASDQIDLNINEGKVLFGGAPIFKIAKLEKASVAPYGTGTSR